MMHGHEKSDLAIVAEKPANKAEQPTAEASTGASAAEPVERRAGTKGNAGQQSTCRAQNRISVSQALERIRQFAGTPPRWEPYAGKPHVRFCAGACDETHVPTATSIGCAAENNWSQFTSPAPGSKSRAAVTPCGVSNVWGCHETACVHRGARRYGSDVAACRARAAGGAAGDRLPQSCVTRGAGPSRRR